MRWACCNSSELLHGRKGHSGIVNSLRLGERLFLAPQSLFGPQPLMLAGSAADSFCE